MGASNSQEPVTKPQAPPPSKKVDPRQQARAEMTARLAASREAQAAQRATERERKEEQKQTIQKARDLQRQERLLKQEERAAHRRSQAPPKHTGDAGDAAPSAASASTARAGNAYQDADPDADAMAEAEAEEATYAAQALQADIEYQMALQAATALVNDVGMDDGVVDDDLAGFGDPDGLAMHDDDGASVVASSVNSADFRDAALLEEFAAHVLGPRVEELQQEIVALKREAVALNKNGQKPEALDTLRKAKKLEKELADLQSALPVSAADAAE